MTHCHLDHIVCAHEFDNRLGYYTCKDAYQQLLPPEIEGVVAVFNRPETFRTLPYDSFEIRHVTVRPAPLSNYLDEAGIIDLGNRVF